MISVKSQTVRPAAWVIVVICGLSQMSCVEPNRPAGVAQEATFVETAKTGSWQVCRATPSRVIHCTIWNRVGTVLLDETFKPVDGASSPVEDDLRVRSSGACTGGYQVCLKNGRILVPLSMFDRMKAFLEGRND